MNNIIDSGSKFKERRLNNLNAFERNTELEHDTTLAKSYTTLKATESVDFFTPVETPVYIDMDGNSMAIKGRKAIVNPDNNEVLSIVSDRYKLVTNQEVFDAFDTALAESNIDLTGAYKSVYVCGKGGRTVLNYSFPAYETTITDRVVGDVVRLSCGAVNSYDGLTKFSTTFDSIRLVCSNSMVTADPIAFYGGKHTQNLVIETAIQKIKRAIDVYCDHAEMYKRWADTPVSVDDGKKLFAKLTVKKGYTTEYNEKKFNEYMEQWLKEAKVLGRNRWSLYNAMTHISTHTEIKARSNNMNPEKVAQEKREAELRKFLATNTDWFNREAA